MNKYNNPRLTNTTIAGSGMKHPVRPHVILGNPENGYIQGDILDANAVKEIAKESVNDIVDGAPEALDTLKELADALNNGSWVVESDLSDYVKKSDILPTADANGHEYVDLGLPSGTLWATMNIGASSVTDYGQFFQWGDTQGYTSDQVGSGDGQEYFGWSDYKYSNNGGSSASDMTKYNSSDGLTVLEASDDAMTAAWGGSWRMPTETEFNELLNSNNCTNTWTTVDGVYGRLFTSVKNGNTLFFPAAGSCGYGSVQDVGSTGHYWSSSLFTLDALGGRSLRFGSGSVGVNVGNRCYGLSVRGVFELPTPTYATNTALSLLEARVAALEAAQS